MKPLPKILLIIFSILVAINLYAEWSDWKQLIFFSKPLLLTTLSLYFFLATQKNPSTFRNLILVGLIFSIAGDIFLMFVENDPESQQYFLFGLASFLITHICYLFAFIKFPSEQKGWLTKRPWVVILFIVFLIGNMMFLWSDIPDPMRLPVLIYSITIVSMTMTCLNLANKIPSVLFKILFIGVLFFVLSDNIIALNKFKSNQLSIPYPRLLIMSFYLLGQYLICTSCVRLNHTLGK